MSGYNYTKDRILHTAYGIGGCVKKHKKADAGRQSQKQNFHQEDLALKTAAQFFGGELLPLLGVKGVIKYIAPTEAVKLESRQMFQDFNYAMEDGSWVHLEFESDSLTTKDLRRFREYEAAVSRTFGVAVVTYVICSSQVKRLKSELTEGINTYRVKVIRLKNRNSDLLFERLKKKKALGEPLTKEDLTPLLLAPLMSGSMDIEERITESITMIQEAGAALSELEMEKMQAVLYVLADKFLSGDGINRVKERIAMTKLGQMIFDDGVKKGLEQGIEQTVEILMEEGFSKDHIIKKLKEKFSLSRKEAEKYMEKFLPVR